MSYVSQAHNSVVVDFACRILRPNGVPLISEFRKSDHTHRKSIDAPGDYKICFDNSASRFHSKIVYFEVIVERARHATFVARVHNRTNYYNC